MCHICKPIRLPQDIFDSIYHFPDPIPRNNDHYAPLNEVYGKNTTDCYRPSFANNK